MPWSAKNSAPERRRTVVLPSVLATGASARATMLKEGEPTTLQRRTRCGVAGAPGLAQRASQLRRHRCLGVGRNSNAGALAPAQEKVAIGGEGGLIERECGEGEVAAGGLPMLIRDLIDRQTGDQGNTPRGR